MGVTSIEWTNKTWNPTRGCSRVSAGCTRCYAETMAARLSANGVKPDSPFHGFVTKVNGHAAWTGKVELIESKLLEPLSWKEPQRIFVNSMSDLFHESLSPILIDRVFAIMYLCPHLTFQCLTKRPEVMLKYVTLDARVRIARQVELWHEQGLRGAPRGISFPRYMSDDAWPLRNVHLGVSVEDQKTADERIPLLLQTPAAKRFVSYEPALGPVDFRSWTNARWQCSSCGLRSNASGSCKGYCQDPAGKRCDAVPCPRCGKVHYWTGSHGVGLDQVIVGGESGPGARPFDIQWARQTVAQCKAAGVKVFVKQYGANPYRMLERPSGDSVQVPIHLADRKGGDWDQWPEEDDLRIRELI